MGTTSVEALKEAIAGLQEVDKVALAAWLNLQTMDEWDREMECDFSLGGRGSALVEKVKAGIRAGDGGVSSPGGPAGEHLLLVLDRPAR